MTSTVSLRSPASAFGTQAAPRGSQLIIVSLATLPSARKQPPGEAQEKAGRVNIVGLKSTTRPTNCRTGEASLNNRYGNSLESFWMLAPTGDCCGAACIFVKPSLKNPHQSRCARQPARHASSPREAKIIIVALANFVFDTQAAPREKLRRKPVALISSG